jgi:hypothetical protein
MPKFEIIVYKHYVRKALDRGQPNDTGLADKWADNNYIIIEARTHEDARREITRRYPSERGFVVKWNGDN